LGRKYFKTIPFPGITAGETKEESWTADKDYILRKLFVKEYTEAPVGTRFLACTFRIDDFVFTLDNVRGELFDTLPNQAEPLDYDMSKNKTIYLSMKNMHSTSTIYPYVVLLLEEK